MTAPTDNKFEDWTDDDLFESLTPMIFVPRSTPLMRASIERRNAEIETELRRRSFTKVTA